LIGCACPISSFSLSLASLFTPLTELAALRGVSGGVVIERIVANDEVAAVIDGTLPATRVGLLITFVVLEELCGMTEDWVAMEDVEFERAGEEDRAAKKSVFSGFDSVR
jgi:hypothetical protein